MYELRGKEKKKNLLEHTFEFLQRMSNQILKSVNSSDVSSATIQRQSNVNVK